MLRADHLTVAYGPHRALEDVSVHVALGEICVILGANGAGKTTLLKAIAGVLHPQPGAHIVMGEDDIGGLAPNRVVEAGLALVPEGRGIFSDLTVAENLELGAYGHQARERRDELMDGVQRLFPRLAERRGQVVRTMSGGEQQMVAIGRALMSNPKILMLDEPSLGLSPILCAELFKSLKQVQDSGVGILLVEQNARLSLAIADRAYLLENGHIKGEGRASAMPSDPAVQQAYLGGAGSAIHRRLGEAERRVVPVAVSPALMTAAGLAERASQISRTHVETQRHGAYGMNGHAVTIVAAATQKREPIAVTQANDLSRKAADMANRAASILAAHVAATRSVGTPAHAAAAEGTERKSKKAKKDKKKAKKAKK